jgi:CO/xanthine dehydrogenase FAD-binding subunit
VEVLTPRSLDEAPRLKAEHPEAVPVQGGTDVLVALNFDRLRPDFLLNLNEVPELRGFARENGTLRLGSGLTYADAMRAPLADALPALAEASRTVGSPQIRNRGTIAGNPERPRPQGTRCRRSSSRVRRSRSRACAVRGVSRSSTSCSARSGTRSPRTS